MSSLGPIVHLTTTLDYGGVEKHMSTIAHESSLSSSRIVFCALGDGGATEGELRKCGAEVICLGRRTKIPSFFSIISLVSLFRQIRPLVVHTHGAEANFHGLIAAWLARVPVRVGEEIGIPCHSRIAKWVFRQTYKTAHRVVGISNTVKQWLIDSREVPFNKTVRIYNPVEVPAILDTTTLDSGFLRIGYVGRLEPVKNPMALLDALEILRNEGVDAELWFIGDGSERQRLADRIEEKGLQEKALLYGYQADPSSLTRQCHIYVQPSHSEGFGIAIVEAMGCGIPVIATAVGGAPEIIDHGVTGWLLSEPTPVAIASLLKDTLRFGPEKLHAMGLLARESVKSRFSPVEYSERLKALYLEVANDQGVEVVNG